MVSIKCFMHIYNYQLWTLHTMSILTSWSNGPLADAGLAGMGASLSTSVVAKKNGVAVECSIQSDCCWVVVEGTKPSTTDTAAIMMRIVYKLRLIFAVVHVKWYEVIYIYLVLLWRRWRWSILDIVLLRAEILKRTFCWWLFGFGSWSWSCLARRHPSNSRYIVYGC